MNLTPVYKGATTPISTQPLVGATDGQPDIFIPGVEDLARDEIRVSILGSGQPWVTKAQASGSVLVEVGNDERDVIVLDLGSGSLANFSGLKVPMTSLTKVFLSHLHADHIADYITLIGSYTKAGRLDPVEVWGGGSDDEALGIKAFVASIDRALAWDVASIRGSSPTTGAETTAHEVPYDATEVVYERNGVTITSFPVIHALNGAVGYRIDFAGQSVVFSGDTRPTRTLVEAAQGCDLLIHETFLPPETLVELTGLPLEKAEIVVNHAHTPPQAAGLVFEMVGPRMAAMWHTHVIDGYVEPVFESLQTQYRGPATLCQDLTIFNVTADAVTARQAQVDPMQQAVMGPSKNAFTISDPLPTPPAWWADAAIDWPSMLRGV